MQKITYQFTQKSRQLFIYIAIAAMLLMSAQAILMPQLTSAADLSVRSLELSNSASGSTTAGQDVTWTFTFDAPATTALNGISFRVCDAASGGTCTAPGSWSNTGAAFGSLSYNGSGQSGWTLDNTTLNGTFGTNHLAIKNNSSAQATDNPIVVTFNTVDNPQNTNTAFFVWITTYTGDDFTGALDTGVVAASTATQITLTGYMDESLVFCSGITITGTDCGTVSGNAVTWDDEYFSTSAARYGTSVLAASTNGVSGYSVTVNGTTLTCNSCTGSPTIDAMGTQTANGAPEASVTGSSQFGMNLRANDGTPTVGAAISGPGSGAQGTNYNTNNQYRFLTGDEVALTSGATDANTYTVSYIVNVPGDQPAGTYTSTMTYIATATF